MTKTTTRAAANNRSDQMNPNNPTYYRGRGASPSQATARADEAAKASSH